MILQRAMRSCLFALAAAGASSAGQAANSDLATVLNEALSNDPVFAAARFTEQASLEAEPQARAALLPNISASASVNTTDYHFVSGNTQALPSFTQTFTSWGPTLQVALPLYRAQLWDSLSQSKLAVRQSQLQFAQAREDLIVRVAQAYFDVLASSDALAAIQTNKQAISEQLAQAQREFEVGTKTIVDTHEARARYDLALAQEQVALGDLIVKKSALRVIIGRDAGDIAPLRETPELVAPQPADVEAWAHNAEQNNFSVLAARAVSEIALRETRRARDAYQPTLDVSGSVQWQHSTGQVLIPFQNNVTQGAIGLIATVPLYTGDLLQSRIREARANERRAEQDLEAARRNAAQAARQAYTGTDYGLAQVRALESAETSAKTQLESTRVGYEVGVRINLDVLNANTQLFNTQRDLKKARYDFLVNGLRLKAASGTLEDRDVQAVNALLQR
ncbi:MAG TPA: TolC family outer membrane protein [Burkholderiaceae bacterium]|jgi:outer membrane protein|nr:TolC family outer membrane protein [Burkholderiaceae bacterium]